MRCFLMLLLVGGCCAAAEAPLLQAAAWRDIPPRCFGYNAETTTPASDLSQEALLDAAAALRPGVLRLPGGTMANYWDWRAGWLTDAVPRDEWPYGLGRLAAHAVTTLPVAARACARTGAEPLWVLNLMTATLDDQLALLDAAAAAGLEVGRVELGNEFYLDNPHHRARFPTATAYAEEANRWAAALKAHRPGIQVAAVATAVRAGDPPRRQGWNAELLPLLGPDIDAVTIHVYQGAGLDGTRSSLEAAGVEKPAERPAWTGLWAPAETQAAQLAALRAPQGPATMMEALGKRFAELPEPGQVPERLRIWFTEYNLWDRTGPVRGTWVHGLFAAAFTLRLLAVPRCDLAVFHDLHNTSAFAALFTSAQSYARLVEPAARATTPWTPTASGTALALVGEALERAERLSPLVWPGDAGAGMSGLAIAGPDGWHLLLVNGSDAERRVDTAGLLPGRVSWRSLEADPRAWITGPGQVRERTGDGAGELLLPPWSITRCSAAP